MVLRLHDNASSAFNNMKQRRESYHLYTRPKEPLPISSSKAYSGIEAPLLLHFSITIVSCTFARRMASRRWWLTASADSGRRRSMMLGLDLLSGSGRLRCRRNRVLVIWVVISSSSLGRGVLGNCPLAFVRFVVTISLHSSKKSEGSLVKQLRSR